MFDPKVKKCKTSCVICRFEKVGVWSLMLIYKLKSYIFICSFKKGLIYLTGLKKFMFDL